jgi:hypothetical protein
MNQLAPWQERMRAAAAEQKRVQDAEKAARLAAAPPPQPEPYWPGPTGLQRQIAAVHARDRQMAEEIKPRPAPQPEPQSQHIDVTYAEALRKRHLGACAEAIAKVESRKQWFEQTKEPK